ncbi:MAG: triose-phosphate isomerase [Candidatus Goldbacteria bacterium]|nr:triose-phosphate isomerase [Candidatus Goldiibacteriota bacterium]
MRLPIIAGNWKMYKTIEETIEFVTSLRGLLKDVPDDKVEIVICPPFVNLQAAASVIKGSNIKLGAQNLFPKQEGAYTGEVSPLMLRSVGCSYVIIGHSERREYFKETNEFINEKVKVAIEYGITPIMCVGEKLEEREKGLTFDVVKDHVVNGLKGISKDKVQHVVIAYEPVWAIGTGKTATPQQAEEVQKYIRKLLSEMYDEQTAQTIRIQYGGSVKPENIKELMACENIDGALVGGASLKADSFEQIVKFYK